MTSRIVGRRALPQPLVVYPVWCRYPAGV